MPNKRTLGYIVLGGDKHPLRWYENEGRFYIGVCGRHVRSSITTFEAGEYEHARRCIGLHYRTMSKSPLNYSGDLLERFSNLQIVRLIDSYGCQLNSSQINEPRRSTGEGSIATRSGVDGQTARGASPGIRSIYPTTLGRLGGRAKTVDFIKGENSK